MIEIYYHDLKPEIQQEIAELEGFANPEEYRQNTNSDIVPLFEFEPSEEEQEEED